MEASASAHIVHVAAKVRTSAVGPDAVIGCTPPWMPLAGPPAADPPPPVVGRPPGSSGLAYELLHELGRGASGLVYKAQELPGGRPVAIKVVAGEDIDDALADAEIAKLLYEDPDVHDESLPDNLLHYHRCWQQQTIGGVSSDGDLWLVMELCEGGPLSNLIRGSPASAPLCEAQIAGIMQAMLRGLDWLHARKRIHRDIKAANILLTRDGQVKIADFGVSASLKHTLSMRHTIIGTPYWMAPELITAEDGYSAAADIWSTGITAIELAEGTPPHAKTMPPLHAMFRIPALPSPCLQDQSSFSPDFHDFLRCCLAKAPEERATASELLTHPFLKAADTDEADLLPRLLQMPRTSMSLSEGLSAQEKATDWISLGCEADDDGAECGTLSLRTITAEEIAQETHLAR
jgi:serine/threonine protein kinase